MDRHSLRRERLVEWVGTWSDVPQFADPNESDVVERLLLFSICCPDEIIDPWLERCLEDEREWWGQMVVHALCLAGMAGAQPLRWLTPDVVLLDVEGVEVALGVDPLPAYERDMRAMERVSEALDRAFGMEEYVLHIRNVAGEEVDLDSMTQAVRLWVATPFDAELCSAVYDDGDLAIHLRRTGVFMSEGGVSRQMTVPVLRGWDEATSMRDRVKDRDVGGRPIVWVCGRACGPAWAPGLLRQLLYGCPIEVRAFDAVSSGERQARFQRDEGTLFGGPLGAEVLSVWWVGRDSSDPLSFASWIHDNPWCGTSEVCLSPPGACYTVNREPAGAKDERRVRWMDPCPTLWRPQT